MQLNAIKKNILFYKSLLWVIIYKSELSELDGVLRCAAIEIFLLANVMRVFEVVAFKIFRYGPRLLSCPPF